MKDPREDISIGEFVHPWFVLANAIKGMGRSQAHFAALIGKSAPMVNYIIKGTMDISADYAIRFSIVFDTPVEFWTNLQTHWDIRKESKAREDEYKAIQKRVLALKE